FYVYALLGESNATTALASYEYLAVTIGANGHQTTAPAWTAGTLVSTQPRWQVGAWVATGAVSTLYAGARTVFVGGGLTATNSLPTKVEAATVAAGGQLTAGGTTLDDTPRDFNGGGAGYGSAAANGQLFTFGGQGAAPSNGAQSAQLVAPPPTL